MAGSLFLSVLFIAWCFHRVYSGGFIVLNHLLLHGIRDCREHPLESACRLFNLSLCFAEAEWSNKPLCAENISLSEHEKEHVCLRFYTISHIRNAAFSRASCRFWKIKKLRDTRRGVSRSILWGQMIIFTAVFFDLAIILSLTVGCERRTAY